MNKVSRPIRCCHGSGFLYLDKHNKYRKCWPFGPLGWKKHGKEDLEFKQHTANLVLKKVMEKSDFTLENLIDQLRDTVPEVRASYPDSALEQLDDEEVITLLAADTCLFIMVIFSILEAELGFPEEHPIFGQGCVQNQMEQWLSSIFFVGNQIPFCFVEKLMTSLKYLAALRGEIIGQGKQPLEMLERTLLEFVTNDHLPALKPVDVLQFLRSIILGPKSAQLHIWVVKSNDIVDESEPQLSASGLSKQGYVFKPLPKKCGSREIKCENQWGKVVVYLPFLEVVCTTWLELMMKSVQEFELVHQNDADVFQLESTWYFNLLSNLVRSQDDVQILESSGIVRGVGLECLPKILRGFYRMPRYDPRCCGREEIQRYKPRLNMLQKLTWCKIFSLAIIISLASLSVSSLQVGFNLQGFQKHH
ncbi:OLC1v1019578C1 [Oldenlandia corymbosa var. corymbosa]|uniref:OLC1v1019578C1 n=1 Tax=Oldenlandia corymbosa var. corymbosa TaxID=529605 RepID=A0AAV1EEE0_OLDCO|nr:OLC1v1019578C1 [Oldenlandia corymbosa var. corymbosa]